MVTTTHTELVSEKSDQLVPLLTMNILDKSLLDSDKRDDLEIFLKDMWSVVNWTKVAQRLEAAKS